MSVYTLLFGKYNDQGWSFATKLDLCMEFIDNMGADDAFDDFLQQKTEAAYFESLEVQADEEEID